MMTDVSVIALTASAMVFIGSFCAGRAIGKLGKVAVNIISENNRLAGKMLVFVALGEAISIYAMLTAFLLVTKI